MDMQSAAVSSVTATAPEAAALRARASYEYDALVLDAGSRQALATVRSLGAAGKRVVAGECFAECDPALPVLAFRSRFSAHSVVLPSFAADPDGFGAGVAEFVAAHPTQAVLPGSDGSVAALMPWRTQLAALGCQLALPSDCVLDIANNKERTLEVARDLGIESPTSIRIYCLDDLAAVFEKLAFPMVLKPTSSWAEQSGDRLQAVEVINEAEALQATKRMLDAGTGALAQEWAGGSREAVIMFIADGEIHASFAYGALRTSPALGGASVLRETMPIPADLHDLSVRLVTAIGMQGLCEVEFRRDLAGLPLLMEVNARLVGGIETARRAGIDFPLMIWQWATGNPVDRVQSYRSGIRMRWLRGDMRWLMNNHGRAGLPDSMSRSRAAWTFATEFLRTPHYDCLDFRDLGPILAECRTTLASVRKSVS